MSSPSPSPPSPAAESGVDKRFAPRPEPPYYAVVFASLRAASGSVDDGYAAMAARMVELAAVQPGYLGVESARGADGFGITVSYWRSLEDVQAWRREVEHAAARQQGRERWYDAYELRVSRVERAYGWRRAAGEAGDPGVAAA